MTFPPMPSVLSTDKSSSCTRFLHCMLFSTLLLRGCLSDVVIATPTLLAVLAFRLLICELKLCNPILQSPYLLNKLIEASSGYRRWRHWLGGRCRCGGPCHWVRAWQWQRRREKASRCLPWRWRGGSTCTPKCLRILHDRCHGRCCRLMWHRHCVVQPLQCCHTTLTQAGGAAMVLFVPASKADNTDVCPRLPLAAACGWSDLLAALAPLWMALVARFPPDPAPVPAPTLLSIIQLSLLNMSPQSVDLGSSVNRCHCSGKAHSAQ